PGSSQTALLSQLAAQLKVEGPVTNRLFVASLDYRVDEAKLKEVFALAGHVTSTSLFRDRDNRSRGLAVVEYESSLEALNAVSMFNNQVLMERKMTVRFDTKPSDEAKGGGGAGKLPSGLKSIGSALLLGNSAPAATTANPLTLSALTALSGLGSVPSAPPGSLSADSFSSGLVNFDCSIVLVGCVGSVRSRGPWRQSCPNNFTSLVL
ncbi:myelin expression factor 2, partial [Brachionus plicatilis]